MTREEIQVGLDNQGFTVDYALADYEVDTQEEFIDKMLVEKPLYQALFWWDAIISEDEQMDFELAYPTPMTDEIKLRLFNKRKNQSIMRFFQNILEQQYKVISVYSNGITAIEILTLRELNAEHEGGDPSEVAIRFREELPDIMYLRVTDSRNFKPCRDDSTSKGIIVRLK
jgi:hypothetical protein